MSLIAFSPEAHVPTDLTYFMLFYYVYIYSLNSMYYIVCIFKNPQKNNGPGGFLVLLPRSASLTMIIEENKPKCSVRMPLLLLLCLWVFRSVTLPKKTLFPFSLLIYCLYILFAEMLDV